jgi:hypothetical protein
MRRRVLIAQGILSSISAVLFTSTGWLMGTRTLRMPDDAGHPWNSARGSSEISIDSDAATALSAVVVTVAVAVAN